MAPNDQKMGLGAKMATSAPSLRFQGRELGLGPEEGLFPVAYALLDSGATHPMRQARDQVEWEAALEVQVALAGENITSMRLILRHFAPASREGRFNSANRPHGCHH